MALMAGCGDESGSGSGGRTGVGTGSVDQFCSDWARAEADLAALEPQTAEDFRRLSEALAAIVYTPEAQEDAETLMTGLDELADLVDARGGSMADLTPQEQQDLMSGVEEQLVASAALSDYANDTCG